MENWIVIFIVAALVGLAAGYIRREKKRGVRCVGCPDAATCSGNCGGCSCGCGTK